MESSEDEAFLTNYRRISQDARDSLNSQRKCNALMHKFALKSLDNQSSCFLLEENLLNMKDMGSEDTNTQVKQILARNNIQVSQIKLKSNLLNLDLKTFFSPLPCSENAPLTCPQSESAHKKEFDKFKIALLQNKPNFLEFKENKYANSVPQTSRNAATAINIQGGKVLPSVSVFKTALEEFRVQTSKKYGNSTSSFDRPINNTNAVTGQKRKLGLRRNINSKFVSPLLSTNTSEEMSNIKSEEWPCEVDERLRNIDPKMVELIRSEIMDVGSKVTWDDIAGLDFAKTAIQEAVVWPMLRPDIFTGLRRPPKGILLFGPPGTGKTLIGKCVASQSKSTFFSISASSLTSKWIGDGEKMVRALFAVARAHQPSVIFIDEIDSLLSQRSETEHESSRRIKTEFLVQLDGATTDNEERLLLIAATNRPQELDEAARRRFVKRLYIPLPEFEARLQLVMRLITNERHELSQEEFQEIAKLSEGYSGADIRNLCSEASLGPIRAIDVNCMESIQPGDVRSLLMEDFRKAFSRIRSSVSPNDLNHYILWDNTYGSGL